MDDDEFDSPVSPTYVGFQRWVRLSVSDAPSIRPPRRHMLSNVTGGLNELYTSIQELQRRKKEAENSSIKEKDLKLTNSDSDDKPNKEVDGHQESHSKDNEHAETDGDVDEETTPYTDDEGEFCPDESPESIPLLASRYKYVEVLARGQSALIIKALDTFAKNRPVAIKVLHRIYKPIGSQEADILLELHKADPWLLVPFARLLNQFLYGPHYCLVFEFLSPTSLAAHYDQRDIRGPASLPHVRNLCVKLLTVLGFLYKQNVIHADLKPENILLSNEEDMSSAMVMDFGNALRNTEEELSLYYTDFELQTLLYRAPEVIFGIKFSLEIDMWSLGCLLAECYTGGPLFDGKTKEEILTKITELLGPFPKEFMEGECADEFSDFIGKPLTRYKRVENLRKKLQNCKDINFLLLLERLLTYLPEYKCYPTVVLDLSTYPYIPTVPEEAGDDQDSPSAKGRKRLQAFSKQGIRKSKMPDPGLEKKVPSTNPITNGPAKNSVEKDTLTAVPPSTTPSDKATSFSHPKVPSQEESKQVKKQPLVDSKARLSPPHKTEEAQKPPLASPPTSTPSSSPTMNSDPESTSTSGKMQKRPGTEPSKPQYISQAKLNQLQEQLQDGNISRTDVKQTLKSMGLRCEDFTISVYSKEQAHAILRKQGVEVTNHATSQNIMSKGNQRQVKGSSAVHPSVSVVRNEVTSRLPPPAPTNKKQEDEDDDDCIILDPPEGSKIPPIPPPVRRLPQQFQLMGTTVQVNRGMKRPLRVQPRQIPFAKRPHRPHQSYYYSDNYGYDDPPETSVQDTLKRLKNYNISITCRRNSQNQRYPMVDSDEDDEERHNDSEDEEDMAKYLECEIAEKENMNEDDDEDESFDMDSSGSMADNGFEDSPEKGKRPPKQDDKPLNENQEEKERKDKENNSGSGTDSDKGDSENNSGNIEPNETSIDESKDKCKDEDETKKDEEGVKDSQISETEKTEPVKSAEEKDVNVSDDKKIGPKVDGVIPKDTINSDADQKGLSKADLLAREMVETLKKNPNIQISNKVAPSEKEQLGKPPDVKKSPGKDTSGEICKKSPGKDTSGEICKKSVTDLSEKELMKPCGKELSSDFLDDEDINEELENQLLEAEDNLDDGDDALDNYELENEL